MKRALAAVLVALLLVGCGDADGNMRRAMGIREKLLKSKGCSFDAIITADYVDKLYTFTVNCSVNAGGSLSFTVAEPQSIAGITGKLDGDGGRLTFDDKALAFDTMADGMITPVSAPWVFINTLRGGYLSACGADGENLKMILDDSYKEEALQLDIWIDSHDRPVRTEILWKGRRVLSMDVKNFEYL